jgi:hypothetical protein
VDVCCNADEQGVKQVGKCKDCEHWEEGEVYKAAYGICSRIKMITQIPIQDPESVLDDEPAIVEDGSDYHAALRPSAEFGCVLFQERGGE